MNTTFFSTVQSVAGGVGVALAVVNGFWHPTVSQNWLAAVVGAALGAIWCCWIDEKMPEIRGDPVELATLAVAFLYALAQAAWLAAHSGRPKSHLTRFGLDFLSGVSIFPLILLIACPFFPTAREAIAGASNLILCPAGVVALSAMLQNAFQKP
jgi:hypothetical protein